MAVNRLFSDPPQVKALAASTVYANDRSPFLVGQPVFVDSSAGTTLYGTDHPGSLKVTKYAAFRQSLSGNKAFALPAAVNTPQNTVGGALSAANQLRVVTLVNGVPVFRARGDQVAPAGQSIVGAGGGTAAGDATYIVDGVQAAGVSSIQVESTGANTKTILVGDKINIAGDTTDYYATATTVTFNGTTAVACAITPPLQKATGAASAVTVTAANGKTILVETAPQVGDEVEVLVLDSADVVTVGNTGGALTAGQMYQGVCTDFMHTAGAVNLAKAF